MNNQQNPQTNLFSEQYKEKLATREWEKIKRINERQSFRERMRPLIWFLKFAMLPLLIIWSIATEIGFAGLEFYEMFNSLPPTIVATGAIILLIEASKLYIGKTFVRFLTHGWLTEGWHYVAFFIPVLLWAILAFGSSALFSIKGGPIIADNIKKQTSTLSLVNVDSIHGSYDTKITPYLSNISAAQKTKWKGNITRQALRTINKNQDLIKNIEAQREQAVAQAIAINQGRTEKAQAESKSWGAWLSMFGGLGEILQIFIFIFTGIYTRVTYEEEEGKNQTPKPQAPPAQQPQTMPSVQQPSMLPSTPPGPAQTTAPPLPRRTVIQGFQKRKQLPRKQAETVVEQQFQDEDSIMQTVLKSNDIRYLKSACKTYYKRSLNSVKEETRKRNEMVYTVIWSHLYTLGVYAHETEDSEGNPTLKYRKRATQ